MYVQLFTKSVYSLLKSSLKIEDYVKQAKAYGMTSVALTDEGNVYGLIHFYKACLKHQIKPILGVTLNLKDSFEIILLAKNNNGYKNILKLTTLSKLNDQDEVTLDQLIKYGNDCILIIPTLRSKFEVLMASNQFQKINDTLHDLKQKLSFVYLGIHNLHHMQESYQQKLHYVNNENRLPFVSLNEVRYLDEAGYTTLRYLEAISKGEKLVEASIHLYPNHHYFVDPEEIKDIKPLDSFENTLKISQMCEVELNFEQFHLPKFQTPQGINSEDYLKQLCLKGLEKRMHGKEIPTNYLERLKYELTVISQMNFNDYFLIVYDYVKFAKQHHILVGPGRGSAAGSLVSYVLGITNVDPIAYDLLFERFLNPERITMPDIDLDFEDTRRDEVIRYVQQKYGKFNMAHIVAFGTFAAKSSIREVGKVMGISDARINEINGQLSSLLSLDDNIKQNPNLLHLIDDYPDIKHLFEIASNIEGMPRNTTTHAAGIVMSEESLTEITALQRGLNDILQSQYEAKDLESLGLIKMDFLGLRNLGMMGDIIHLIEQSRNKKIDIHMIPLNDAKTFRLIAKGDTTGIFQLESDGMRKVLRDIHANQFEDIVAVNALYRPGPMDQINAYIARKKGLEKVEYLHPDLKPILEPTYGIIVYQEQIMQIAQKIAKYSLGKADLLRRAVGKKQRDVLEAERDVFIKQAITNHYQKETAEQLFNYIVKFGDYGFNRSHSVAYSMISYQLAFLKANYPIEFMTVLLSGVLGSDAQTHRYLKETRRYQIPVLPVSINFSYNKYVIENNKSIRMAFLTLKGLGHNIGQALLHERENGLFESYFDFVNRTRAFLKQNVFKALVYSGALDEFKMTKRAMIENYQRLIDLMRFNPSGYFNNQFHFEELEEYPAPQLMKFEKDVLGFYLTTHPIRTYLENNQQRDFIIPYESSSYLNKEVKMVAYVENVKEIMTKNNEPMMLLTLSDDLFSIPAVIFPNQYERLKDQIVENQLGRFQGKINMRNSKRQLLINNCAILK
jgi:DNA polymerase III subunit alpha